MWNAFVELNPGARIIQVPYHPKDHWIFWPEGIHERVAGCNQEYSES